jgi:hypothetical protein
MLKILIYIVIGILLVFGYIKYIESQSFFYPLKNIEYTPDSIKLPFKNVYIKTQDNIQINGWFIPCSHAKYTILFFHGNAGNIGLRLEKIRLLHDMNMNIFIIDYRGYGNSQGRPSEQGLYSDAKAAYDYLVNNLNIKTAEIIVYGESLGAAVAVHLACEAKVAALILEGAFSKSRDLAEKYYPLIPSFLFSDKFNSLAKIKKVSVPKLFMHSRTDEIVPFVLAKKLYNAADNPKKFIELSGSHNATYLDSIDIYLSSISLFIKGLN